MLTFPNEDAIIGALHTFPDVYYPLPNGLSWNIRELYDEIDSVKLTLKLTYTIDNIMRTIQAETTIAVIDFAVKTIVDVHANVAAYIVKENLFRVLVLEIEHKIHLRAANAVQQAKAYREYHEQFAKILGVK